MMWLLWMLACKAPVEAPSTLDALCGFLFTNLDEEDPEPLEVGLVNLDIWLDQNREATLEGYTIQNLSSAVAAELGREGPLDGLVGAAVGADNPHPPVEVTRGLVWPEQTDLYPETYLEFERTYTDNDPDCFLSQQCDWLAGDNHLVSSYPLGLTVTSAFTIQFRWVDTPAGPATVYRTWMTKPADANYEWMNIQEQFYLGVNLPLSNGRTRRLMATWILAEIGDTEVPENLILNMIIDSMANSDGELSAWIEANPG